MTYSTSIFDTFGVLSSFSFAETIWSKYEKYAIPKIEDTTLKLRGSLFYLKDLTPKQAQKELKSIDSIIPILCRFRSMLEPIDDQEFINFKNSAIEFLDTVDLLHNSLQDIAQIHSSYEMSMSVLAEDWDRKEDNHWDKY
ncbi:MAG: hypothetical protein KAT68_14785 [Bacteroidales bacterium]|nr:hypothetical protein [Bacteroidales bacterium]